jgi:mannitol-specific phosphotransferase system IIBC component
MVTRVSSIRQLGKAVKAALPIGSQLPDGVWGRRHAGILAVLWLHAIGIACFSVYSGNGWAHSVFEAILVHLSGGYIEFHFHFFVMVGLMALYQEWTPFLLAITFVLVHHGVVGVLDPSAVYNHPAAVAHPWRWAAIHATFIAAMSIVSLITWRVNEPARAEAEQRVGETQTPSDSGQVVTTLAKGDEMIFLGKEEDGFLQVETGKGSGWVKKILIAR